MRVAQDEGDECDVCGAAQSFTPVLAVSLGGLFDADVHRCGRCGFRQVRPRLTRAELLALYSDDYFDPRASLGFRDYARQQQREERRAFMFARAFGERLAGADVLEIGCALGFFLDGLRKYSGASVRGVDVSPFAAEFARRRYGLDVEAATLEEAKFPDASFDLIVQKDLLEHVQNPRAHLIETHRILRPGGLTWLVTPNGEANLRPLARRLAEERSRGTGMLPVLDQGHVSFFSLDNLRMLFSGCGFEVARIRTIHLKRGLRALGFLPAKRSKESVAPGGRPRPGSALPEGGGTIRGTADALHEALGKEVDRVQSNIRGSAAYFRFRAAMEALGRLPAGTGIGLDFDCLLRRAMARG